MRVFYPKLWTTLKTYNRKQFINDFIAGIIVAIIALPLSIALAIASGVTPEMGLWTAVIAGFVISFLGGSRVLIGGPTGAFMIIVYGVVVKFGIEGLIIATVMAGVILVLMGLLRLGSLIKFIPFTITTGFTSGIAVVIFTSQIKDFFGLEIDHVPAEFLGKWHAYFTHISTINSATLTIGLVTLAVLIVIPKINSKIPASLIGIIVATLLVKGLGLPVETIGSKFGALSNHFPAFTFPNFSYETVIALLPSAFTIAMLGAIESLLACVVSDGMIGGKHRSNTELIAQGIANITSGLFGGIPATGAIARTAANIKNGGRTPVAGIVHALVLGLIVILLMPLASLIPLSALGAILMIVAYNMSEWREFLSLLRSPKSDVIVLLVTFGLTVLVDLVVAIEVGLVLAALLFVKRMADLSEVKPFLGDASEGEDDEVLSHVKGLVVYDINGPFFFGAADKFVESIHQFEPDTKVLVLRMRHVPMMDATALNALKRLVKQCEQKKIKVMFSGVNDQPMGVIRQGGLVDRIGESQFKRTYEEALATASALL